MENAKLLLGASVAVIVTLVIVIILQARDKSKKQALWEHTQHQLVEVLARREQLN